MHWSELWWWFLKIRKNYNTMQNMSFWDLCVIDVCQLSEEICKFARVYFITDGLFIPSFIDCVILPYPITDSLWTSATTASSCPSAFWTVLSKTWRNIGRLISWRKSGRIARTCCGIKGAFTSFVLWWTKSCSCMLLRSRCSHELIDAESKTYDTVTLGHCP